MDLFVGEGDALDDGLGRRGLVPEVRDDVVEDFAMLPAVATVSATAHDHMLIGRNEIGVQHLFRTLAAELDVELD